jgi:hypothetical protein
MDAAVDSVHIRLGLVNVLGNHRVVGREEPDAYQGKHNVEFLAQRNRLFERLLVRLYRILLQMKERAPKVEWAALSLRWLEERGNAKQA